MAVIFKNRCQACNRKLGKNEDFAQLRLQTTDGLLEMNICRYCSDVLDASADLLRKSSDKERNEQSYQGGWSTVSDRED